MRLGQGGSGLHRGTAGQGVTQMKIHITDDYISLISYASGQHFRVGGDGRNMNEHSYSFAMI